MDTFFFHESEVDDQEEVVDLFETSGHLPHTTTSRTEILGLISRLRPIKGGFDLLRVGPTGDGGYLVPDDLAGIEACFSPGVGDISGFELDCAGRGMKVFLADHSVAKPSGNHECFTFTKNMWER